MAPSLHLKFRAHTVLAGELIQIPPLNAHKIEQSTALVEFEEVLTAIVAVVALRKLAPCPLRLMYDT